MEFPERCRRCRWLADHRIEARRLRGSAIYPATRGFHPRGLCDGRASLVGICFGHQIMAQALGGRVEKYTGGWSAGRVEYRMDGEVLPLVAWHQDQVVEKPEAAEVLCSTDFCRYAALAYGDRAMSMQPHPEFDDEATRLLLETRAPGVVPPMMIETARQALGQPLASDRAADRIAAFFKEAAHG